MIFWSIVLKEKHFPENFKIIIPGWSFNSVHINESAYGMPSEKKKKKVLDICQIGGRV